MLYCYKPLDLFWTDNEKLDFKAFHVTPYLKDILSAGEILPTIHTGKSTLGENKHRFYSSIRGCLVSFFDDFQLAMNGCYSLTIYALLKKKLISSEQFIELVRSEWISVYGDEHSIAFETNMDLTRLTKLLIPLYMAGEIGTIFKFLQLDLDFQNPHILTTQWVDDLPNSVDGVLESIGVLEVAFDKKYIADPSVFNGAVSSIYGDAFSKGDFGRNIYEIKERFEMHNFGQTEDEAKYYTDSRGSDIAEEIIKRCKKAKMSFSATPRKIIYHLRSLGIVDFSDDLEDLEFDDVNETINVDNEVTFVSEVTVDRDDLAIWNPSEHEWRIPAFDGIPVSEANVVAFAGDIQTAMGSPKLTYEKGTTVRGRKNHAR